MAAAEPVWQETCKHLQSILNEETYRRWIAGIVPLSLDDGRFRLGVSNDMFCDWLRINYRGLVEQSVTQIIGDSIKVEFESGHEPRPLPPSPSRKGRQASGKTGAPGSSSSGADDTEEAYNARFTFDTFVVGENNRFAHAACVAVAKSPGKCYNPLFVHGGVGLGKTHLLQAIGQEVKRRRKRAKIEYLSSEEFSNTYIDALQTRKLSQFRSHYRNVDLLLIDDVHFFTGKEGLQEEFFHTFNALYHSRKQIVLASDRPPHEIGGLEKRLVSRFEWGLTTDIQPPDLETRLAILGRKQDDHEIKLGDEVLFFLASRIKSNIRRLEGALIRLVSYASVTGMDIDIDLAERLLGAQLDEEAGTPVTVDRIQKVVAEFYDIRLSDMSSKRRPQRIAAPRQVAMYLCRRLTDFSSPAIAEHFSRNHATILHAVNAVERRMAADPEFRREVSVLERRIKA